MSEPKILLYDLETAPALGYCWGKWEQNIIEFKQNGYILCFSYKWLDKKKVHTAAIPDYFIRPVQVSPDESLAHSLHKLFDEADVVVAHNGDNFDAKTANARFLVNSLDPPSPYKSVDTLKLARKHFRFPSNKLDDLAQYMRIGRKLPNQGKDTWLGCMEGDAKAWNTMRKYNAHDVWLLEQVYLRLRAWGNAVMHVGVAQGKPRWTCPHCGHDKSDSNGRSCSAKGITSYRRVCRSCHRGFSISEALYKHIKEAA